MIRHQKVNADEFSERLWDFAVRVATRGGRHVAGQLFRCGTSSAPNYDEGCAAESREDFAHKLGIATKEMRETRGWLRFIIKTKLQPESKLSPLLNECEQLLRMLTKSVLTAKLHPNSKSSDHKANYQLAINN
jgi:four helix bundle protein